MDLKHIHPSHINDLYPVKQRGWRYDVGSTTWSAQLSDLEDYLSHPLIFLKDPWGRSMKDVKFKERRDTEGKLLYYVGETTVKGKKILMVVWDD